MSALADDDCRAILIATADEPLTVSELCAECEIPMATAYRKVNRLAELTLLDERIRVEPRGPNSREYLLRAETIRITVPEPRSPAVTLNCTITTQNHARSRIPHLSTDGGQTCCDSDTSDRWRSFRMESSEVSGSPAIVEPEQDDTRETTIAEKTNDEP